MNAKKTRKRAETDPRCGRVAHYRDALFDGKVQRMADYVGLSHSLVSMACNSRQSPGRRLLAALADHPRINPRWLYDGLGDPLLPPTGGTLAISNVLLPGLPGEHPDLLTGERFPVPETWERASCYWLRLGATFDRLRVTLQLPSGWLILVETARSHLDRLYLIQRHPCIVASQDRDQLTYHVARIWNRDGKVEAKIIGLSGATPRQPSRSYPFDGKRRTRKISPLKKKDQPANKPPSQPQHATDGDVDNNTLILPDLSSVVGVMLYAVGEVVWSNVDTLAFESGDK